MKKSEKFFAVFLSWLADFNSLLHENIYKSLKLVFLKARISDYICSEHTHDDDMRHHATENKEITTRFFSELILTKYLRR